METTIDIAEVAKLMGFTDVSGDVFFGKVRGFPVGFKLIDPSGYPLALFHIRHPFDAKSTQVAAIKYQSEVADLISEKKLEIDHQDKIAWVSLPNCTEQLVNDGVRLILNSVLDSFTLAGLAEKSDLCHYCGRNTVQSLICDDGKVAQICPACLEERTGKPADHSKSRQQELAPAFLLTLIGTLVGVIGWTLFWIGYQLFFDRSDSEVIYVPRILEGVALICAAGLTGAPVGFAIKKFRARTRNLSRALAIVGGAAAVLLGEIVFVSWLIYREYKVIDLRAAARILPRIELAMGAFHLAMKILAAIFTIVFAVEIAKPPKPSLKL